MFVNIAYYGIGMLAHVCYPELFPNDVVVGTCISPVTAGRLRVAVSPLRTEPEQVTFETRDNEYLFFRPHWDPDGRPQTSLTFTVPGSENEPPKGAGSVGISICNHCNPSETSKNDPRFMPFPGTTTSAKLQLIEQGGSGDAVFEISLPNIDFVKGRAKRLVDCIGPLTCTGPVGLTVWDRLE